MFLFLKVLLTEFIAEMGDKTQLMLVAMTQKFKIRDIIIGTAAGVLVLNGIAVVFGGLIGSLVPAYTIKVLAAFAFMLFAVTCLQKESDEDEDVQDSKLKFAPIAVFCTFFVAELGDKTQLTAITFGANEGMSNAIIVWLACSVGLFAADIIGMLVGYFLKSKMPEGFLNILAFFIFAIFGVYTSYQAIGLMPSVPEKYVLPATGAVAVIFVLVCAIIFFKSKGNTTEKKAEV